MRQVIPNIIKPIKYTITLTPNFTNFTFSGLLEIDFETLERTKKVILNSKELEIKSCKIGDNIADISYIQNLDRVEFTFEKFIEHNSKLQIIYTGILNDDMAGFYKSEYKINGQSRYLATTQFEAIDARRAFPCIDEPAVKAVFRVILNIDKHHTALSNTPIAHSLNTRIDGKDYKTVIFEKTPIMSTYLLAFCVGEFEYTETFAKINNKHIPVRVYTIEGEKDKGIFSRDLCAKVLEYFSDFFEIYYPLDKMDMIAIPDFSAGAMENWGLITYRNKYILCDDKTSETQKMQIAYTVCHELAHQWFGNIVTMSWWSELWLNEGFATWVGWHATNHFFPQYKVWEEFYKSEYKEGLELDALENSHPIQVPINRAEEIDEIFDAISYSKGACIIAMLVEYIGIDDFRKGVVNYLKKFQYGNATTEDLWKSLEDQARKPVEKIMYNWTRKTGYPLVTVNLYGSVSQQRFNVKESPNDITLWSIPLTKDIRLDNKETNIFTKDFKLINRGRKGFYRVNYDSASLELLATRIINKSIDAIDRAGIIDDLFNLSRYKYYTISRVLDYAYNYYSETEYVVLASVINVLDEIKSIWYNHDLMNNKINEIMRNIMDRSIFNIIDLMKDNTSNNYQESKLRTLLVSVACELEITEIIEECKKQFYDDTIVPELIPIVYKTVMKHSDNKTADFDRFVEIYKSGQVSEKTAALLALGSSNNEFFIKKALDINFNSGVVRKQDIMYITGAMANGTKLSRKMLLPYVFNNFDDIILVAKDRILGSILSQAASTIRTREEFERYTKFLDNNKEKVINLTKTLEQEKEAVLDIINLIDFTEGTS